MFGKDIYVKRRNVLKKSLKSGVILLPGNDPSPIETFANHYLFRQNSLFAYYTGINKTPSVTLIIDIDNNKEILFADDYTLEDQIWTGSLPPFTETAEKAGICCVKGISELKDEIDGISKSKRHIHYPPTCRGETLILLSNLLDKSLNSINKDASQELISAVVAQRELKSKEEIQEIEAALDVSYETYHTLLDLIEPGLTEKELHGVIDSILTANGSTAAFPNILTRDGHILHNLSNENILKENDLLLIDTGAVSQEGLCSDITRTFPVSGKFTEKQKAVYNIVLDAQLKAIDLIKPGVFFKEVHLKACEVIADGLKELGLMKGCIKTAVEKGAHAIFMPHGLGHMMGMDDHDMEVFGEDKVGYDSEIQRSEQFGLSALRFARRLKVDHVVTVEPGIYFIPGLIQKWKSENKFIEFLNYEKLEEYMDFGGIRIEDDILVTVDGFAVLGEPVPKTVEDIENIMNNRELNND
jgi:Xaa-Pro aminopeptidase